MTDQNCAYCVEGDLVDSFGIKIRELPSSKVYLFREQSHRGRVIVASKFHVSELVDLSPRDQQAFLAEVSLVAKALHTLFHPQKVNYGAYGDTGCHLHFHLVPKYADDPFEWGSTFAMNPKRTFLSEGEYAELVAKISAELLISGTNDFRAALEALRREVKSDGRVDYGETTFLLEALAPYEETGMTMGSFVKALREVREDGRVTEEESARLLSLLDDMLA